MQLKKFVPFVLVLGLFCALFAGCGTPPATVAYVDLQKYAGLWYQIAAYPQFFNLGLAGVTAEYSINDDGTVRVFNRGLQGGLEGPETTIEGTARIVDAQTNAKLAVRFNFPLGSLFEGEYWIITLDSDYTYAVVSDSRKASLFILSRTPTLSQDITEQILTDLETRGFDIGKLIFTQQSP
ncbi:MAG: hypothetical protein AMXMBFR84_07450 [Candidatus Hydrogenedentota bacterium]